ncbi:arsenate reductase [soil metagenome]
MLKLFGLRKCTTCQKAVAWLDQKGVKYDFVDVKDNALDTAQVSAWSKALGGWEKMINRAGYTWRGLPSSETADLTEDKAVALAVRNPSLIRRPLIEYRDGTISVGFSDKVRTRLG